MSVPPEGGSAKAGGAQGDPDAQIFVNSVAAQLAGMHAQTLRTYDRLGLVIPHRREKGQAELPDWKEEHNTSHRKVRARVEHVFARMKGWKILRDCRLKGDGVHHAMLGIARLHNLALAG